MTIAIDSSPAAPAALSTPPPLRELAGLSLFLDFDGTLVEIAERPDLVVVAPELPEALALLADRLDGRLAMVSGRSLAMLDHLLGPLGIAMAGSHGGEFRPAGAVAAMALAAPFPDAANTAMKAFAQDKPGLVFEAKPFSAAVHYRGNPALGATLWLFAQDIAARFGLKAKHGKMVVELATPGSDKGNALDRFMALPPFVGTRPIFVGDDVTDEDGFAAVGAFGGAGVLVGAMRETRAIWRLESVAAVHRWLEDSA